MQSTKPFGILAWPGFSTRENNPYNYMLYSSMERAGFTIYDFELSLKSLYRYATSLNFKVFHLHWPTHLLFGNSTLAASMRLGAFMLFVRLIKWQGRRIVWTVHNMEAHDGKFPALQRYLNKFLYKQVDGFISLNKQGLKLIKEKTRSNSRQFFTYIPHPHYKAIYPNQVCRQTARATLGVPADKFVFLFLGQMRAYKGVIGLVNAFRELNKPNSLLLLAGSVHGDIKNDLQESLKDAGNVWLKDAFVQNEELQLYFNCANVVVTPYNQIFNSGSAYLNLSFNKPTLAPDVGAMKELQELVGPRWVKTYAGKLNAEILQSCMEDVVADSDYLATAQPSLDTLHPDAAAQGTISFYQHLLQAPEESASNPELVAAV